MAVRKKRLKNYWEPIHDPKTPDCFKDIGWDFTNNNGPKYCTLNITKIDKFTAIEDVNFTNCDFEGKNENIIVFKKCSFEKCDFGSTHFHRVKFTDCKFTLCSLTLSSFIDCEFRGCSFERIGLSGNETVLEKTLITNPQTFIRAAYTKLESLPDSKTQFEQRAKLEETKSTLSRIILTNLTKEGSERTFYEAVKTTTIQESRAKIYRSALSIHKSKKISRGKFLKSIILDGPSVIGGIVDLTISYTFGTINAWGASLSRPVLFGFIISLFYAYAYKSLIVLSWPDALRRSIEVMFLFGYTSHSDSNSVGLITYLTLSNALIGVAWYVISVPTVVNKLTRVRS